MAFNPILQAQVTPEQPVEQPSMLGAVADAASAIIKTSTRGGQSGASSESQLNNALADAFMKAEAARSEDGDEQRARTIERNARINFARHGGDFSDSGVQDMISSITGRPAEHAGFSQEEVAFQETLQSPEFQSAFLASKALNPDLSDQETIDMAFSRVARAEANETIIQETLFNWNTNQGQSSRITAINDWREDALGVIHAADQQGAAISNDTIQAAQVQFQTLSSQILASRPNGLSASEWKPVADQLNAVKEELDFLLSLTSTTEIKADALRSVLTSIQTYQNETGESLIGNLAVSIIADRPSILLEQGVISTSDFNALLHGTAGLADVSIDSVTAPAEGDIEISGGDEAFVDGVYPTAIYDQARRESPSSNFNEAAALARTAVGESGFETQEAKNRWMLLTNKAFASVHRMAAQHEGWLDSGGYQQLFPSSFFQTMRNLRESGDRTTYETTRLAATRAIEQNRTAVRAALRSVTRGDIVTYDSEANELVFNRETFLESSRIPGIEKREFIRLLDSKYGGDFNAAIRDRGTNSPTIMQIREELEDTDALTRIDALNQLDAIQRRLPAFEPESDSLVGGSFNEASANNLTGLIDRTEGVGDYGTLFGHSQRSGGQFSGVDVTTMTLGELQAFTDERGEGSYGQWVKENNPEGVLATPLGRYQIVGDTLDTLINKMGLPTNILFTQEVQDAMFHQLAKDALAGKDTAAAKREAMRSVWAGLRDTSDAELDRAIASFEGTSPPSVTDIQANQANVRTTPQTSPRPTPRPGEGGTTTSVRPTPRPTVRGSERATESQSGALEGRGSRQPVEASRRASQKATQEAIDTLVANNFNPDEVAVYETEEEVFAALESGEVQIGDAVVVNGKPLILQESE